MTTCYVTQIGPYPTTDPKEIEDMWANGTKFRVYRYQTDISKADTLRLRMSGFVSVTVVYLDADMQAKGLVIDLERH